MAVAAAGHRAGFFHPVGITPCFYESGRQAMGRLAERQGAVQKESKRKGYWCGWYSHRKEVELSLADGAQRQCRLPVLGRVMLGYVGKPKYS